jgi:hypothetical protein
MHLFPLTATTLYADLVQKVEASAGRLPGSISTKTGTRGAYLYAVEKHGSVRIQRYVGPAGDPEAQAEAEAIKVEAGQSRLRRTQVATIKRAGIPGPSIEVGRLLEAISRAGLFDTGLVLVGTIAFSLYPPVVGARLEGSFAMTQDADFAVASIADAKGNADLMTVLRRADPSFQAAPTLDRKAFPKKFRAESGFEVEILTPVRSRADVGTVNVTGIGAGATPLQFLEFLIEDAAQVVALYNDGVSVRVPQPERYAVHKLVIAQERKVVAAKRAKDLKQADVLMQVLEATDPYALEDALDDARARGPKWRTNIDRSLEMIKATHLTKA